jgi:hypothetical protein
VYVTVIEVVLVVIVPWPWKPAVAVLAPVQSVQKIGSAAAGALASASAKALDAKRAWPRYAVMRFLLGEDVGSPMNVLAALTIVNTSIWG